METRFRKLAFVATAKLARRISELPEEDAGRRYQHFVEENADLLQRISLGELAKYLGITQQSLSSDPGEEMIFTLW